MKRVLFFSILACALMFATHAPASAVTRQCAAASAQESWIEYQNTQLILNNPVQYNLYQLTGIDLSGFGASEARVESAQEAERTACGG